MIQVKIVLTYILMDLKYATYGEVNASSGDYIYCAWAAAPSVDLFGGCNAR